VTRVIHVAVPVPSLDALTYRLPDDVPEPPIGTRVLVPLGSRVLTGCVVSAPERQPASAEGESQAERLKTIIEILDDEPFLPAEIVRLSQWVAEYYACGAGEALAAAMPPRAWIESERHAQITETGRLRLLTERGIRRAVLDQLEEGKPLRVATLESNARGAHRALLTLERDGLAVLTQPLRGQASAYRTTRVVMLTAQGLDVAADDEAGEGIRLGERQRAGEIDDARAGCGGAAVERLGGERAFARVGRAGDNDG